jgi:hypothetical protein
MSMKSSSDTIGNRTPYLLSCSAVPQPTAPPAACPRVLCTVSNYPANFSELVVWGAVKVTLFYPPVCTRTEITTCTKWRLRTLMSCGIWRNMLWHLSTKLHGVIYQSNFPLRLGNSRSPHGHINQRLQIQFRAPDDERCSARNMLSLQ